MKIVTAKKIQIVAILAGVVISSNAAAETLCESAYKDPVKSIMTFTKDELNRFEEEQNELYKEHDLRTEVKQTIVDESDPRYDLQNAKGQIYNDKYKMYAGAGNMISPCHMLTAYHVVDLKKSPISQVQNSPVKFDFFADQNAKDYTKKVVGVVVAGNNNKLDYAVIRIDSLRGKRKKGEQKIPFLVPVYDDITDIDQYPSLSSGNSLMHKDALKPAALHGMMVKAYSNNQRIFGNINISPGDSGGSVDTYFSNQKKFRLVGLHSEAVIDSDNKLVLNPTVKKAAHRKIIATPAIAEDLEETNPGLLAEIKHAQDAGFCEPLTDKRL